MPIKGLSDQLRLPRLGKIRLGEKKVSKKTGKEYPSGLDYFVVPEEVKKVHGEMPRRLEVMFPLDDEEIIFPQYYKRYGQTGLKCRGDGREATRMRDDGQMEEIACPGTECKFFQDDECRPVGNLQFMLWKVSGLGVYQIDTSGKNSFLNINGAIKMIKGFFGGRIRWIPLILTVKMEQAHPWVEDKETGQRKRITRLVPVMSLTAPISVEDLIKQVKEKEKKGELPGAPAEIINPEVDEKPELLYKEKGGMQEEEEKEGATEEEEQEEEVVLSPQDGRIQELFEELDWPPTRQKMVENKYKDKSELINYLEGKLKNAREQAKKEGSTGQSELFQT